MKKALPILILASIILFSCQEKKKIKAEKKIDYSNKSVLDSLIQNTTYSKDTLFLGFQIGMNKNEYKDHIHQLRKEGKQIDYSSSNKITNMAGTFDLGAGYKFKTSITDEIDGKTYKGQGTYFLNPIYNNSGELSQLTILPIEKFQGDYSTFDVPKWLEKKIIENSQPLSDEELKKILIENDFIDKYDFVREKENIIIYENTLTINYIDLKTLYAEILIKKTEKEIIKENNEDVQF